MQDRVNAVLEEAGLAKARPVTLAAEEYFKLLVAFAKHGIHFRNNAGTGAAKVAETVADAFAGATFSCYVQCGA